MPRTVRVGVTLRTLADLSDSVGLLRRVPLFVGLERVSLARLLGSADIVRIAAGEDLFRAGDEGDALFIIAAGELQVVEPGTDRVLSTLGRGDHLGELALLTREPRSATVRARTDAELLRLGRDTFERQLARDPSAWRVIATALAHRMRGEAPAHEVALEAATPPPTRSPAVRITGVGIALACVAIAALPIPPGAKFVALLGGALALWMTATLPPFVTALALVVAWVATGVALPFEALQGFGSSGWIFAVSVLGIAGTVSRSAIVLRAAIALLSRLPQSIRWQAAAFVASGLVLTPVLPLAMARAAVTAPLALAVAEALRLRDRSRESATLGLAAWIGSGPLLFAFLNGSPACLVAWALLPAAVRERFDWATWAVAALPLALFVATVSLAGVFLSLRPAHVQAAQRETMAMQLAALGPMTFGERAVVAILLATVVGWATGPLTAIDPGVVAIVGFVGMSIAARGDPRTLAALDWGYLVYYGVLLAIGPLAAAHQLDRALATTLGPVLLGIGVAGPVFVVLVALLAAALRTVLLPEHVVLLIALLFIPVASVVGVSPWLVMLPALAMCLLWHMPEQSPEYLVAYTASDARLWTHGDARRAAFIYAATVVLGIIVSMPYWAMLGLV